tara:strand:+ start:724 stop:1299 length:576 start_codon:yes stop_codon:yes gene_type:complete
LSKNNDWKILDIGCGYRANKYATVISDVQDLTNFYKDRNFIKITDKKLPFKDKEFDYVIASHVIEHVEDFQFFIKELERISSKGYIELPSRLGDNLVFENATDHIWWFVFDDISNQIIASKRSQLISPFITVSIAKLFEEVFRESFVLELEWNDKIDYKISNEIRFENFKKISFFKLIRKYISKKIRSLRK